MILSIVVGVIIWKNVQDLRVHINQRLLQRIKTRRNASVKPSDLFCTAMKTQPHTPLSPQKKVLLHVPVLCIIEESSNLTLTFLWWIPFSSFCNTTFLSSLFSFSRRSSIRWYFDYISMREMEYKTCINWLW